MKRTSAFLVALALLCTMLSGCGGRSSTPNTKTGTEGLQYEAVDGSYVVTGYSGSEVDIIIPDTYNDVPVTTVGESAFEDSDIQSVVFGQNLTQIENIAFSNANLLKSVTFTAQGVNMGINPFVDCSSLTDIQFAGDAYAESVDFSMCNGLTEVSFPEGLTDLDVSFCENLTTVTLPDSLTSLGGFYSCSSLTSVTFSDNIEEIERLAFEECTSLEEIVIPASVTYVGEYAFDEWESNQTIIIEGSTDGWQEEADPITAYGVTRYTTGSWDAGCDAQIEYKNAN